MIEDRGATAPRLERGEVMRYYYSLEEAEKRITDYIEGNEQKPITLYPETDEIVKDFESNGLSDWWGVYRCGARSTEFADFATRDDAEKEFNYNEGVKIYERMHDC